MHLKSLTLRGFKSFASATTLQLEPGITCIVGPNGSGKSNVVDALAWVMGEQGAKTLRGGKMEDVIFAGTGGAAGRAPLGRAEVALTIDNSDGALPIDYAEVTISRTMFRNGGSDYAINGSPCRLLDVQELLSDSGIGREMHVIVGQGRLDSILHATPEDRRGFVEEAAGVLKHRKRKEKALRKLESTDGNLTRLQDLIAEIRRQLGPLGRQAEVARRAAVVQADLRDARARLLADEVVAVRTALAQELADESLLLARRAEVETALAQARASESAAEAGLRDGLPDLAQAQETGFALAALGERLRGTAALAAERVRSAAAEPELPPGRDPEAVQAEVAALRDQERAAGDEVVVRRSELERAAAARLRAEEAHTAEDRRVAAQQRAAADRREGLARLQGQAAAKRSRVAAAQEEIGRLTDAQAQARARQQRAERAFTALETQVAGLDAGEEGLDAEHEAAAAVLADVEEQLVKRRAELAETERERTAVAARREALELGLRRKDGAGALLAATPPPAGLVGSVAAVLSVRPGFETAVAAALGPAADAVALAGPGAAVAAIDWLRAGDHGRAGFVLGGAPAGVLGPGAGRAALPDGASYAADLVDVGSTTLRGAVDRLLAGVAVVRDLGAAQELVAAQPELTAVTVEGDVLGSAAAAGGSSRAPSLLEVQAAVDEAAERLTALSHAGQRLGFELSRCEAEHAQARQRVDVALARLHESDAHLAAVAEELAQHGAQARAAGAEADRLAQALAAAQTTLALEQAALSEAEQRLTVAADPGDGEPASDDRDRLAQAAREARAAETDARLALRTAEERARALAGRADDLERAAAADRDARARALAHRERVLAQGRAAREVDAAVAAVLARLRESLAAAAARRAEVEAARRDQEVQLRAARARIRELAGELDELVGSVHRDELARAQQRMRLEQLEERAMAELGLEPDALVEGFGPDLPVPVLAVGADGEVEQGEPVPFDRTAQQTRLRAAERALAQLGRVNPLALEEYSAMEERHRFLAEQLEDLRRTRADLLGIVREVDERVQQVFAEAWEDVRVAFDHVFARLFPGGEGRLVLTDPDDLLATGIEVEARPPGKKVKRLSLLSGGERSLVAVAFLVALFKARPSPFYILDEVEAALDDTNLGRLLEIYAELRDTSQLLVITHQKRTMEVADALYGVTMRGDGVTTVISQRLREPEPV